jgi:hypothetical protein
MGKHSESIAALSPEQRAYLELRLAERRMRSAPSRIAARPRGGDSAPLSFAQQRLWFLDQLEPGNAAYNIPDAVRLSGPLAIAALEHSLSEIVRRHESLRTVFKLEGEQPRQVIETYTPRSLLFVDLSGLTGDKRDAEVLRLAGLEARRSFNLSRGPLLRATLLRLSPLEHVLFLTMHHIVSDAWSLGIFVRELASLYDAYSAGRPSRLAELPIQYADFAQWQHEHLRGETLEAMLNYWKQQLGGVLPVLQLPTDRPRPQVQTFRGSRQSLVLPLALGEALTRLSRREGCTLFMLMLAAFGVLLHRYTGQSDIVIGTNIANRNRAEVEDLIGFFVNMLALRTNYSGDQSFRDLLRRVRDTTLNAYAHQDMPFDKLVDELRPERTLTHPPLFQIVFSLQNAPTMEVRRPNLTLEPVLVDQGTAKFDLVLNMWETERGLKGSLEFNLDLFEPATITRMLRHFERLLDDIAARPDARLDELEMLSKDERSLLGTTTQVDELGESFRL